MELYFNGRPQDDSQESKYLLIYFGLFYSSYRQGGVVIGGRHLHIPGHLYVPVHATGGDRRDMKGHEGGDRLMSLDISAKILLRPFLLNSSLQTLVTH